MRILFPFYFFLLLLLIGCKKEQPTGSSEERVMITLDSLSKEKAKINLLELSAASKKELENFEDFENLQKLIKTMRNSNAYYVHKYADSIDVLIQSFKENLTSDLKVNTISSRISILTTESGLLMQLSTKKNCTAEKLIDANIRLVTAYNSLIIQLNELSLAIPDTIEKELLRDNEILKDSISETEKQQLIIEE